MKYASLIFLMTSMLGSGCAIYTSDEYSYGRSSSWQPPVWAHSEPVVHSTPSTDLPPPTRPPFVAAPPYAQNLPSDHINIQQVPLSTGHKGHRPHKGKPMQQQASDSDW